jgi:branched-chain amino acid transport system substrate-binding protein
MATTKARTCAAKPRISKSISSRALEKANSLDTEQLRSAILGEDVDAPQGRISINPVCGHANLWNRIGRANRRGQFDILHQSGSAVSADPYLVGYGRKFAFS